MNFGKYTIPPSHPLKRTTLSTGEEPSASTKASKPKAIHHVAHVKKGDHCVAVSRSVKDPSKVSSPIAFRVTKITETGVIGKALKDEHVKGSTFEATYEDLVCNLGPSPTLGSAFGVDFRHLYKGTKEHDNFGDIHFFFDVEDSVGKTLWAAFTVVYKKLRAEGLEGITLLPIVYEIVSKQSKYAGHFKMPKDITKDSARCQINVGKSHLLDDMVYVIAHELGHAVEHFYLRKKTTLRGKWLDLFAQTSLKDVPTERQLNDLKQHFLEAESLVALRKVANEENDGDKETAREHNLFITVLRYLHRVRGISTYDLSLILQSDPDQREDRITEIWPDVPALCAKRKTKPLVTEYATTNVSELFAEAFAHHLVGMKLPKDVTALMERSIQAAIKSHKLLISSLNTST